MRTPSYLPDSTALWRYLAAWLVASAAVVAGLVLALHDGGRTHPEPLTVAAERASCRFIRDSDRPPGGTVVLSYRATLSREEVARVLEVARRLAAPAVSESPSASEAVAAENGDERLGCPRVDARAEDAITLFVLSSELDD
jgi:hypothetical protein